jgi:hypothetical protein
MLEVLTDGSKLPPHVILNNKTMSTRDHQGANLSLAVV